NNSAQQAVVAADGGRLSICPRDIQVRVATLPRLSSRGSDVVRQGDRTGSWAGAPAAASVAFHLLQVPAAPLTPRPAGDPPAPARCFHPLSLHLRATQEAHRIPAAPRQTLRRILALQRSKHLNLLPT